MRLRGPWIVRGSIIDTAISSQSGSIPGGNVVNVTLSPYSFCPDIIQRKAMLAVDIIAPFNFIFPPNADAPKVQLYNAPGAAASYEAEWRHISP